MAWLLTLCAGFRVADTDDRRCSRMVPEDVSLTGFLFLAVWKASRSMRLQGLSGLLFLLLVGCASDSSLSYAYAGGRESGVDGPVGTSLLVRGGETEDAWAVFLPVELQAPGIEGWSTEALRTTDEAYPVPRSVFISCSRSTPNTPSPSSSGSTHNHA